MSTPQPRPTPIFKYKPEPKPKPMPTPKPPPPIGHASADGMVIIEIGADKTRHHIHKALLVHHSEYFAKALNGPWAEAEQRVVSLDDVGEHEFNLFVNWLYTQRLPDRDSGFHYVVSGATTLPINFDGAFLLVKSYVLGDRILAHSFRRKIHNCLVRTYQCQYMPPSRLVSAVTYAFANISSDRAILQFLVNKCCEDWEPACNDSGDYEALLQFPPSFMARVMIRLTYERTGKYHGCFIEHTSEEEKKFCGKVHMNFVDGIIGYGYFGEPIADPWNSSL